MTSSVRLSQRHWHVVLSADPCESSTACYWVVNINLNLLSRHVVTIRWILRVTFLKVQFSKKKHIFKLVRLRKSSTPLYNTYNEMEFISCVSAAGIPILLPYPCFIINDRQVTFWPWRTFCLQHACFASIIFWSAWPPRILIGQNWRKSDPSTAEQKSDSNDSKKTVS